MNEFGTGGVRGERGRQERNEIIYTSRTQYYFCIINQEDISMQQDILSEKYSLVMGGGVRGGGGNTDGT
jgi:hypothetical protein